MTPLKNTIYIHSYAYILQFYHPHVLVRKFLKIWLYLKDTKA